MARYDGFISYSHAVDGALAPALQDGLQRLAKPWNKRRALNIFRDETGLSTNPHLWSSVEQALDGSDWFVLLASPEAAQSSWVNREIAYWVEHKRAENVLPVVTDGSWEWQNGQLRGTAVPPELADVFVDEPRHLDLRWARTEADPDLRHSQFRGAVADLAAPMHGIAKDDLESEDIRQHRRVKRLARSAIFGLGALALIAALAALTAFRSADDADRSAARALDARDESDFQRVIAQSGELKSRNRRLALLLAVEARHQRDTAETRGAIQAALLDDPRYLRTIPAPEAGSGESTSCALGGSSVVITLSLEGALAFADIEQGRSLASGLKVSRPDVESFKSGGSCATSQDGTAALLFDVDGWIWPVDPIRRTVGAATRVGQPVNDVSLSPDGRIAAIGTTDGHVLIATPDGSVIKQTLESGTDVVAVDFSDDGTTLASTTPNEILLWDVATWQRIAVIPDPPSDQSGGLVPLPEGIRVVQFSHDGRMLINTRRNVVRLYDVSATRLRWEQSTNAFGAVSTGWSADDQTFFVQGTDGAIERRASLNGAVVAPPMMPAESWSSSFTVMPDGRTLVTTSIDGGTLGLWALDGRSAISDRVAVPGQVQLGYSPDGQSLLAATQGASSITTAGRVWDTTDGHHVGDFPNVAFPLLVEAHTLRGFFVDVLAVDRLDLATGERLGPRFPVPLAGVVQAAATEQTILVGHDDGSITRFEQDGTEVGNPWLTVEDSPVQIRISDRVGVVVVGTSERFTAYRLRDASVAYTLGADVATTRFSDDGELLATSNLLGDRVTIRDALTGEPRGEPIPTNPGFDELQIGDGTVLVASRSVGQLFDLETRRSIGGPFPSVNQPVLRSDGHQLATDDADGIILWDLDPERWERAACEIAGRNLTRSEWTTYFPNSRTYGVTCPEWPAD